MSLTLVPGALTLTEDFSRSSAPSATSGTSATGLVAGSSIGSEVGDIEVGQSSLEEGDAAGQTKTLNAVELPLGSMALRCFAIIAGSSSVVAVVPLGRRLSTKALAQLRGLGKREVFVTVHFTHMRQTHSQFIFLPFLQVRFASFTECIETFGFPPSLLPPFAHRKSMDTYIDSSCCEPASCSAGTATIRCASGEEGSSVTLPLSSFLALLPTSVVAEITTKPSLAPPHPKVKRTDDEAPSVAAAEGPNALLLDAMLSKVREK